MKQIVGIRFRNAGKSYYFDPAGFELKPGNKVIVETARGMEMGSVVYAPREVSDEKIPYVLKPVLRLATDEDLAKVEENLVKEKEAYHICKEKIEKHNLDMKLVKAEYAIDSSKLLFYFTAEGRVDFRELVKDLASEFHTRIELRQIGVRDETRLLGGMGICGRELCCATYLNDFAPVSIKMAKEQNLSLNPTKISGVCGRLMCCLNNEEETYEYLNKTMPRVGEEVTTVTGVVGIVQSVNILRQKMRVVVEVDDVREIREYEASEIAEHHRRKRNNDGNNGGNNAKANKNENKPQESVIDSSSMAFDSEAPQEIPSETKKENVPEKRERHKNHQKNNGDGQNAEKQAGNHQNDENRKNRDGKNFKKKKHHKNHDNNGEGRNHDMNRGHKDNKDSRGGYNQGFGSKRDGGDNA